MNDSFDEGWLIKRKLEENKPCTFEEIDKLTDIYNFIRGFYGDFAGIFNENLAARIAKIKNVSYAHKVLHGKV